MITVIEVFPWNKLFETGVLVIDEQHKKIITLINLLASHLAGRSDSNVLNEVIDELTDYAAFHFETEEAIWQTFLAGETIEQEHKNSHSSFISSIQKLKQQKSNTDLRQLAEEVIRYLIQWLVFHILENDIKMAKVIEAIRSGLSFDEAKQQADEEMRLHGKFLVKTILNMYEKSLVMTLALRAEIETREKLETKLKLAMSVVEHTLDAICVTDSEKNIIEANPAFFKITKLTPNEVIGQHISQIKSGLKDEPVLTQVTRGLLAKNQWSGVVSSKNKQGEDMVEWLSLSSVKHGEEDSHYVAVFSEITHLTDRLSNMEHMAYHDSLTGLPNRALLNDRLNLAIANADRENESLAICYLDLDNFKSINDSLGHEAGDKVLKVVAERISAVLRVNDTISRIGGDEFILLLGGLKKPNDYKELLERVANAINQVVTIGNHDLQVTSSIGLTIYPEDKSSVDDLIQHADSAMYQSKQSGETLYKRYSPL